MKVGYFLSCEEYTPDELVEQAVLAERGGLHGAVDQRPLPPVERRAGPESVRLVGDRCHLAGLLPAGHHRGDLPDRAASTRRSSPRPQRPQPCCSKDGSSSGWGRARRSTSTFSGARGRTPSAAWTCWRRRSRSSGRCGRGKWSPMTARTTPSTRRASTRCRSSHPRSTCRPSGPRRWRSLPGSATGSSPPSPMATRSPSSDASRATRRLPRWRASRWRTPHTAEEGLEHAHRLWANSGRARGAGPGAALTTALRAGLDAGHQGGDRGVGRVRQRRRVSTARRSARTRTLASTRCTSRTWALGGAR